MQRPESDVRAGPAAVESHSEMRTWARGNSCTMASCATTSPRATLRWCPRLASRGKAMEYGVADRAHIGHPSRVDLYL